MWPGRSALIGGTATQRRWWGVWRLVLAITCGVFHPAESGAQLALEIRDGRVSLDARDASVADILAEWARVGQTTVLGAETLAGTAVTIHVIDAPESDALDIILRQCAGYVVTRRPAGADAASLFQRLLVLPFSHPPSPNERRVSAAAVPVADAVVTQAARGQRAVRAAPAAPTPSVFETDDWVPEPAAVIGTPSFPIDSASAVPGFIGGPAPWP